MQKNLVWDTWSLFIRLKNQILYFWALKGGYVIKWYDISDDPARWRIIATPVSILYSLFCKLCSLCGGWVDLNLIKSQVLLALCWDWKHSRRSKKITCCDLIGTSTRQSMLGLWIWPPQFQLDRLGLCHLSNPKVVSPSKSYFRYIYG